MKNFEILQQPAAISEKKFTQQVVEQMMRDIFAVPWGHHMLLIDKYKNFPEKALFFVHQTVQNGWKKTADAHHI